MKINACRKSWLAKTLMAVALFVSGAVIALAQTKTVSGTVIDQTGEPVIGANIVVAGTTEGTVTDLDGKFSLSNVKTGATLKVSFIGYETQSVTVGGGNSPLNITLKEDNTTLDDVVVVGYGTMRRRDLTGSVASITGDKIAKLPVANVAEALAGQLPGVNVIQQDGRPGATASIRVRGGGSITQSNDPLYIVDGVQVSRIDDIPADNIESIDVLKDAASTAIYGARGANGVILITTKSAKEGKASVKYNVYYQLKAEPKKLDVMSAYDNVLHTWGYATAYGQTYGDNIAKYYGLGSANGNHLEEYRNVSAHNYMDDVLQNGNAWNHDLSVSGGSQKTKYFASINYTDNEGNLITSGFKRMSANLKLDQEINKKLKLNIDARYSEMEFSGNQYGYASQAYRYRPIDNPLGSDDASLLGQGSQNVDPSYNPIDIIKDYENLRNVNRLSVNSGLTWSVIKGLTAKTELYLARNWSQTQVWNGGHTQGQKYNEATLDKGDGYNTRWDTTLSYDVPGLGKNNTLNLLVGNEILSSKSNSTRIYGTGYPEEWDMGYAFANISMSDKAAGRDYVRSTVGTPSHSVSWFGRANYSLLDRYLLTATFRADGSSKFLGDNRWGFFPAAAAAWRISGEPFMQGAEDWLDNLKLRLSIGTSGNDGIDASSFYTLWSPGSATINGQSVTIYNPSSLLGNPDLKWETTISRNIGLDYSFWNGRLNGSVDIYANKTEDVLMRVPCDPTSGFSFQMQNVAETSNKGIEVTVNYRIINTDDFMLNLGVTMNHNVNKVEKLADGVLASAHTGWGSTLRLPYYDYIVEEGQPVGIIMGYKSAGVYTVDDFNVVDGAWILKEGVPDCGVGNYVGGSVYNRPAGQNAFPGMAKFEDVDDSGYVDSDDVTIVGKTQPKVTGGFNLSGAWKGIDFAANFTYQFGGKVYNANVMHSMMGNKDTSFGQNRLAEVSKTWKMFNVDGNGDLYAVTNPDELRELNRGAKYGLTYSEYGILSSDFVEDATFLRLQSLTVGYSLPKNLLKKAHIERLRFYFTAGNLFCLSKYSGLDPEVNVSPNADSSYSGFPTPNYDYLAYPKARTFTFGANLTF